MMLDAETIRTARGEAARSGRQVIDVLEERSGLRAGALVAGLAGALGYRAATMADLERAGEPGDQRTGAQARALLENVEHLAAAARGFAPGGADGLGVERHCSAPASSRMGMYRSSTTAPITPPMRSIRIGSNRRVNHSTQRARSSSK